MNTSGAIIRCCCCPYAVGWVAQLVKKQDAIKLFGTGSALARALRISKSAVSQWPEELPQRTIDEITGAALRLGKIDPSQVVVIDKDEAA